MGKASRRKRGLPPNADVRVLDPLGALRAGRCMHCGTEERQGDSPWCRACNHKGQLRQRWVAGRPVTTWKPYEGVDWPKLYRDVLAAMEDMEAIDGAA